MKLLVVEDDRLIQKQTGGDCYTDGTLSISFSKMTADLAGEPITFTPMEYRLLIYSVECMDDGTVIDNPNVRVGDTVRLNCVSMDGLSSSIGEGYEFIIMAKVRNNENTTTTRNTGTARFYLPTETFLPLCNQPHIVDFSFNVKAGTEPAMEESISDSDIVHIFVL